MMWTLLLLGALHAAPAADTLASVDLYGLRTVPEPAVRAAIGLRPGDPAPESADSIRARVAALPGVAEVDVARVWMKAGPPAPCGWAGSLFPQVKPHGSIVRLSAVVAAASAAL